VVCLEQQAEQQLEDLYWGDFMADDFSRREMNYINRMARMAHNHPDKDPWTATGKRVSWLETPEGGGKRQRHYMDMPQLWGEWQNYQEHGQRVGEPKPPETWLTRRRGYMGRRYTSTPEGGFSGALGGAAVQRKRLLGA